MDSVEKAYWFWQTMESLKYNLNLAVDDERYEDAANIRDEINRRNGESKTETIEAEKARGNI